MPANSKPGNQPKPESGNASGGSQTSQPKQENKEQGGGAGSGGDKQPKPGQGDQPSSGGGGKESPNGKGGNPGNMTEGESRQMDPSRRGESTNQSSSGAPAPQLDNAPGEKKVGESNNNGQKPNDAQSPGNSEKTSDSKGQTQGDRKGGGSGGGGGDQHSKKNGQGTPGSHSVGGEDGGAVSNEKGAGAPGNKAGEKLQASDKTGSQRKEAGSGGGEQTQPSEKPASDNSPKSENSSAQNTGTSQAKSGAGQPGAASQQPSSQGGSAFPAGGSRAGDQPPPPPAEEASQSKPDEVDPETANKQVDLALRHLKDEMSKPKSDLMDRLGWTPEEAKKFVENIEKLRDSAKQPGNEANKTAYHEFLKDLGLRPHGTRIDSGKAGRDDLSHVRAAGQLEPPAEWDEVSRQYSRKTAGGQK